MGGRGPGVTPGSDVWERLGQPREKVRLADESLQAAEGSQDLAIKQRAVKCIY